MKTDEVQVEANQNRVGKQGSISCISKKNTRTDQLPDVFKVIEEF